MLPLNGTMLLLRSSSYCKYPMRLQAEPVQNCTCGIPNSLAASTAKQLVVASETTPATGGRLEPQQELFEWARAVLLERDAEGRDVLRCIVIR